MKIRLIVGAAVLAALTVSGTASAQLYAASGSNGVAGRLYRINQANGAMIQNIGALVNNAGAGFGMTGMEFMGGTLYGVTANASPTNPGWLVSINTNTGLVTPIGAMGVTMSDITARGGVLYGWGAVTHNLYTINTATGVATLVGNSGNPGFGGGGLAANAAGTIYASPNATTNPPGFLYTVNPFTGAITQVGPHTGNTGVLNSMTFVGSTLYAIQGNQGSPSLTNLVTVNTATGAVTVLGPSIDNLDSLAAVPEPGTMAALGIGIAAILRRRKLNR
jgi:hypothetical protein